MSWVQPMNWNWVWTCEESCESKPLLLLLMSTLLFKSFRPSFGQIPYYYCRYCGKAFTTADGHYRHERQHLGPALSCLMCGKTFGTKQILQRHVHGVHEKKRFDCGFCGKTFSQLNNLQTHKKHDCEAKPWSCMSKCAFSVCLQGEIGLDGSRYCTCEKSSNLTILEPVGELWCSFVCGLWGAYNL